MKRKVWLLGLLFALTSCGQDVALALGKNVYNEGFFADNMYQDTVLTTTLAPANIAQMTSFDIDDNDVIVGVAGLRDADRMHNGNQITDDVYAQTNKLSNTLSQVKYGFESKLFDGILHCSDAIRLSKSRLQIRTSGFGYVFPESLATVNHAGLYLKAGADTSGGGVYISDARIHLSFYVPVTEATYHQYRFSFNVNGIRRSDFPQLYGFYFDETAIGDDLAGATAFGVTYEILDAAGLASDPDLTGIFVYEMLLPNSTWQ